MTSARPLFGGIGPSQVDPRSGEIIDADIGIDPARLRNRRFQRVEQIPDPTKYPEFLEKGRHIGSGPTESMCRATTERLKGAGRRWDADNAEALMAIEALEQSGGWQAYWDSLLAPAA